MRQQPRIYDPFLEFVKPEDLPGDLKTIAEHLGVSAAIEIHKLFMSMELYIPKNALDGAKKRYIAENYNGENIKQLSRDIGKSTRFVRKILNSKMSELKQTNLFDQMGANPKT